MIGQSSPPLAAPPPSSPGGDDVYVFPASFAQARLRFLCEMRPDSPFYNVTAGLRLTGPLALPALRGTLDEIVARHEAWRTTFGVVDGEAVQVIHPAGRLALPIVDLTRLPGTVREREARARAEDLARRTFELSRWPLVRVALLRLASRENVLAWSVHHIVGDGWSIGVFNREFAELYDAFSAGRPSPLAPLPVQYADFTLWQRERLRGERLERLLAFWRDRLGDDLPVPELPTDRPRPRVPGFSGGRVELVLPTEVTAELRSLTRRLEASLFMTLLSAFQILLHRYSHRDRVVVGTPVAGRTRPEVEGLLGFFVNTLALPVDCGGDPLYAEVVEQVRDLSLEAQAHQDLPFDQLVADLRPERDPNANPLFQVMFAFQQSTVPVRRLRDLTLTPFFFDAGVTRFDLECHFREDGERLLGVLVYSRELFDGATVRRMARHFLALLEGVVRAPEQRISRHRLLGRQEVHQVLREWNDTAAPSSPSALLEPFRQTVARAPEAVALVENGWTVSYGALGERAWALAHHLRTLGVGPDVPVAVVADRSLETALAVIAVLEAGGACVPLDPGYPAERLAFMIADALEGAPRAVVLARGRPEERFPALEGSTAATGTDLSRVWDLPPAGPVGPDAPRECLAYLIYTSGSTGRPKGAAMNRRALSNLLDWEEQATPLGRPARTLQFASLSFDVSFQEILSTWRAGGTLVLVDEDTRRDPRALHEWILRERVERLFLPAVALRYLAEAGLEEPGPPPALEDVVTAGEQLRIGARVARWMSDLDGCRLHNQYGPSESHVVTALILAGDPAEWPAVPTVGRAVRGTRVHLLDRRLEPVSMGVSGELWIGGRAPGRGYHRRPGLTAARFVPDPFGREAGGRLYRTGDLARHRPDGEVEFLGRTDEQVKVRGYRVEPGEVEEVLGRHPAVREVVVRAVEDRRTGGSRLVAYLERGGGERSPEAEVGQEALAVDPELSGSDRRLVNHLREHVRARVPDHSVPSSFVLLDAFPLTPSGKVDRRALPDAGREIFESSQAYEPPRSRLEEALASIWKEILQLDRLGVRDNFFDLGGHSLLLAQVRARIREELGREVSVMNLFEHPTLETLALHLVRGEASGAEESFERSRGRSRGRRRALSRRREFRRRSLDRGNEAPDGGEGGVGA